MSDENKPEVQQIELSKLGIQELSQLKKQLDQELGVLEDSIQTLKVAQCKYSDSKECLEKVTPTKPGSFILVPLTGSMFVPGSLASTEKVTVEIGTGYFVNMDMDGAKDYFQRRVDYLTDQIKKIQTIGHKKNKVREAIVDTMEVKIQAQLAAHSQSKPTN